MSSPNEPIQPPEAPSEVSSGVPVGERLGARLAARIEAVEAHLAELAEQRAVFSETAEQRREAGRDADAVRAEVQAGILTRQRAEALRTRDELVAMQNDLVRAGADPSCSTSKPEENDASL